MEKFLILVLTLFCLASCDCTYQYDVLVKNETGNPIEIKYKSSNDKKGVVEETVTVANGELKKIISTKDIDGGQGCSGISSDHCQLVADYVQAYLGEKESNINWCSDAVKLQTVDIGQGEFILTYTTENF